MLKGQTDGWPGSARGASANRIHYYEHFTAARGQEPVEICGSSGFFHAVASQVRAHICNELFRVGHTLILT